MMAIVEDVNTPLKGEDFPANVIPATAQNGAKSAIVPSAAFADAFKTVPKRSSLPVLECVAVVMGKTETVLGTTDAVRTVRNIEGHFPNYEQVIPKDKPKLKIKFSPKLLGKACKIAQEFGLDGATFEFTTDKEPVKITGTHNGQMLTVVVMPMQPDR